MNKKKYHIICIGCQMNKSDSERIGSYLESLGYEATADRDEADLVSLSTCGVRQSAEDRVYGLIPKIKKRNPKVKIVLSGCLSDREDVQRRTNEYVDVFLNIKDLPKLESRLGHRTDERALSACDYLKIEPHYSSKISVFVPIGNGCDNFCTYCVVPYARGREEYRDPQEIIDEIRSLVLKGYKEFTLIAQNVNSYRFAGSEVDFADLLKMANDIPGDFWLRFATSHPKDMSDKLIETMAICGKLCRHLHLPAQSGDNEILRAMNRKYKIEDYKALIRKIKDKIPDISLSTDIIVGFPGETEEQFENTKKLFAEVKYDMAYVAQYSPRPLTAASKMEDNVGREDKKRRENELMELLSEIAAENNRKYLNRIVEVLVERKNSKGEWIGKTRDYKTVKMDASGSFDLKGEFAKARISSVQDFGLCGDLLL